VSGGLIKQNEANKYMIKQNEAKK